MSNTLEVIEIPPVVYGLSKDGPQRKCTMCKYFKYEEEEKGIGTCSNVDFILERMSIKNKILKQIDLLKETTDKLENKLSFDENVPEERKIILKGMISGLHKMIIELLKNKFDSVEKEDPNSNRVHINRGEDCEYFENK